MSKAQFYFDPEISNDFLKSKSIVVIGYGSQGRAQALNAFNSGVKNLKVALPEGSKSIAVAESDGLEVVGMESASEADVIILLAPDGALEEVWNSYLKDKVRPGTYLGVAHGYAFRFKQIVAPSDLNIFLVAPKGSGAELRLGYVDSNASMVMARIAAFSEKNNFEKYQLELEMAKAWGKAIGCAKVGLLETSFKEETDTNLFGEQAIILGGVWAIIKPGFEVMVEAGYSPEMAYLESAHALRIVADLLAKYGIEKTNEMISRTAEFGGYIGERALPVVLIKERMHRLLTAIQDGTFEGKLSREARRGYPIIKGARLENSISALGKTGGFLRSVLKTKSQN